MALKENLKAYRDRWALVEAAVAEERRTASIALAVDYADQWAHSRNQNDFPYYYWDCVNYLSQVMYIGGLPMIRSDYGYTVEDWWYECFGIAQCDSNYTWKSTPWMNDHAYYYWGPRFSLKTSALDLSKGDFFLMDLDPNDGKIEPTHARVTVGWGLAQEGDTIGQWGFLANSHSNDRYRVRWDYLIDSPPPPLWFWHVTY